MTFIIVIFFYGLFSNALANSITNEQRLVLSEEYLEKGTKIASKSTKASIMEPWYYKKKQLEKYYQKIMLSNCLMILVWGLFVVLNF